MRENQRRSRARKLEYVRELELELSRYKEETKKNEIESKLAVQRLSAENAQLRKLLLKVGVDHDTVQNHLVKSTEGHEGSWGWKLAIPQLQKSPTTLCSLKPSAAKNEFPETVRLDGNEDLSRKSTASIKAVSLTHGIAQEDTTQPSLQQASSHCSKDGSCTQSHFTAKNAVDDISSWCQTETSSPTAASAIDTTLCTVAAQLIRQYNSHDVDMVHIYSKLREGFRREICPGGGCRVQSHILFRILDEISEDAI